MPLVDDEGNEIDLAQPWCIQTERHQVKTNELIEVYREELEHDYGKFKTQNLTSGRVLLTPEAAVSTQGVESLVIYLSDTKLADPFIVIDDFTPEIWPEWQAPPKPAPVNRAPSIRPDTISNSQTLRLN